MGRVLLGLLATVLIAIFAAKMASETTSSSHRQPTSHPWAQNKMEFFTWNDEKWVAWIRDDAFEHRPQNKSKWSRHSNPSLAFIDWEGESWQAKIDGREFLLAYRGDWNGPVTRVDAIRYRDWEGKNTLRTIAQLSR